MSTRTRIVSFAVMALALTLSVAEGGEKKLPPPQTSGGKPIFDVLRDRASPPGNAFPAGKISDAELSTILWAASGLNRPNKGWTVPFAMGVEPYCRVYVVSADGVFRYNWADHSLVEISGEDIRSKVTPQPFAKTASHFLVFVTDKTSLEKNGRGKDRWDEWMDVAVGAMTQDAYLAADALGIGVRYAASMDEAVVRKALAIPSGERPICLMPMGKK